MVRQGDALEANAFLELRWVPGTVPDGLYRVQVF